MDKREPLDWIIEVCVICGCQLGPGIGSRTSTGRCVEASHRSSGGMVLRVLARTIVEQDAVAQRRMTRIPNLPVVSEVSNGPT